MNAQEFRDTLSELGLTQSSFGRLLTKYGHAAKNPDRSVRRWAKDGPMSEAVVIMNILRDNPGAANRARLAAKAAEPRKAGAAAGA